MKRTGFLRILLSSLAALPFSGRAVAATARAFESGWVSVGSYDAIRVQFILRDANEFLERNPRLPFRVERDYRFIRDVHSAIIGSEIRLRLCLNP